MALATMVLSMPPAGQKKYTMAGRKSEAEELGSFFNDLHWS